MAGINRDVDSNLMILSFCDSVIPPRSSHKRLLLLRWALVELPKHPGHLGKAWGVFIIICHS